MAIALSIWSCDTSYDTTAFSGAAANSPPRCSGWPKYNPAPSARDITRNPLHKMHAHMACAVCYFEIFYRIVLFVPVSVVNYLVRGEHSPDVLAHNKAVLLNISALVCHLVFPPHQFNVSIRDANAAIPSVALFAFSSSQQLSGHSAFSRLYHGLNGITECQ